VSDVVVAGAGMAGLVAAARLRELGAEVELR
jgi:phytoene dehydrogenase-like protein